MSKIVISKSERFARIVSYVFDGSVLALPVFVAACFYNQEYLVKILPLFFISIFFTAILPYAFILYLYKDRKISDIQIPKRRERILPLIIINFSVLTGFLFLFLLDPDQQVKTVYLIYLAGLPVLSIITVFWKISFHASYVTMFSIIYLFIFGKWALFALALVPLVSWSRVKLRRHTIAQVIAGIFITGIITGLVIFFNGYFSLLLLSFTRISKFFIRISDYLNFIFIFDNIILVLVAILILCLRYFRKTKKYLY